MAGFTMEDYESQGSSPFTGRPYSQEYWNLLEERQKMPVYKKIPEILAKVNHHKIVLIQAETGAGKTTQIPQFVTHFMRHNNISGKIMCTQPKKLACRLTAIRVAKEMDAQPGTVVGWWMRGERNWNRDTSLIFATEGTLLAASRDDNTFTKYRAVIVDEAHERGTDVDLVMGMLKRAVLLNPELRVIIMTATMDKERFIKYFTLRPKGKPEKVPPHIFVKGRMCQVGMRFMNDSEYHDGVMVPHPWMQSRNDRVNWVEFAFKTVYAIMRDKLPGDILIFCPGIQTIRRLTNRLVDYFGDKPMSKMKVLQLYGSQTKEEKDRVQKSYRSSEGWFKKKVIVSTNIAETSITIDGVRHVIDSGFAKDKAYDWRRYCFTRTASGISHASAMQRLGRSGRKEPGTYYPLFPLDAVTHMTAMTPPQILRSDLLDMIAKQLGMKLNPIHFDYLTQPTADVLKQAFVTLFALGVVEPGPDPTSKDPNVFQPVLTEMGAKAERLGVDIRHGICIVEGAKLGVCEEMCAVSAWLCSRDSIWRKLHSDMDSGHRTRAKKMRLHKCGDVHTFLNVFREFDEECLRKRRGQDYCYHNWLNFRALDKIYSEFEQTWRKAERQLQHEIAEGDDLIEVEREIHLAKDENICKAYMKGFFTNVGYICDRRQDQKKDYRHILTHERISHHRHWPWKKRRRPNLVVFAELVRHYRVEMSNCCLCTAEWFVTELYQMDRPDNEPPNTWRQGLLKNAPSPVKRWLLNTQVAVIDDQSDDSSDGPKNEKELSQRCQLK